MTRHLHIEPVDLVDLLAAEWAQEERAIASHRATHASHRARILGLGHSASVGYRKCRAKPVHRGVFRMAVRTMSAPAFTPGPWRFQRMESAAEFAALKGETLAEHEGYYRTNGGDWIITVGDLNDDERAGPICHAMFKGKAKRGEAYNAPDPEGQANARLIAAAPALYEALEALMECWPEGTLPAGPVCVRAAHALAQARGESA